MNFENIHPEKIPSQEKFIPQAPSVEKSPETFSSEKSKVNHYEVSMKKTWEDRRLPDEFKADAFRAKFFGTKKIGGIEFLQFEGISFGIPKDKIPGAEKLRVGDELEIIKLNHDGSAYGGDGIVAVSNITRGTYEDYGTWQRKKDKEIEELKAGKADDEHVSYTH